MEPGRFALPSAAQKGCLLSIKLRPQISSIDYRPCVAKKAGYRTFTPAQSCICRCQMNREVASSGLSLLKARDQSTTQYRNHMNLCQATPVHPEELPTACNTAGCRLAAIDAGQSKNKDHIGVIGISITFRSLAWRPASEVRVLHRQDVDVEDLT